MIWFARARKAAFLSGMGHVRVWDSCVEDAVCCPCLSLPLRTLLTKTSDFARNRDATKGGWITALPRALQATGRKHFFFPLPLFRGMRYEEPRSLLSLQHVLIYGMRSVIIEFRAER